MIRFLENYLIKELQNINVKNFDLLSPQNEREKINLSLRRMQKALFKLDNPCSHIPAIQIVGTNGKGSISAFLENILCIAKMNIGATTSPHLFDISERIRVNQIKINKNRFEILLKSIQKNLSNLNLTPFELIICCGLKYFDEQNVELLILEAGLGGRYDATTAHKLRPIIAFGNIGIDHTEYLGDSLEKIAREKVAVIEKGSLVVSSYQKMIVRKIINDRVKEVGASIFWVKPLKEDWILGLKGNFQKENAAVAVKVSELLNKKGWFITKENIQRGLAHTSWPGRLETITWKNKKLIIDSAHNSSAAKVLANERENWKNQENGVYWIIGVQKQKDIILMIKNLIKKTDKVLLVPVPRQESWTLSEISKKSNLSLDNFREFKNFQSALENLEKLEVWPKCIPVLTGSIYLVSEFLKYLKVNQ